MFSVAFLVSYSIYKLKMIAPRPLKTEFNNVDWKNKLNNPTTIIDINPIKRNFPKKLTSLIKIDKIDIPIKTMNVKINAWNIISFPLTDFK